MKSYCDYESEELCFEAQDLDPVQHQKETQAANVIQGRAKEKITRQQEAAVARKAVEEAAARASLENVSAVRMQRAFHERRSRKELLKRTQEMNVFKELHSARVIQRSFRKFPDTTCERLIKDLITATIVMSVSGTKEQNSVLKLQRRWKRFVEIKKEERRALKRLQKEERMRLYMSVALGSKDTSKSVPWSTYAKKPAAASIVDDGGNSLYGGPPRRQRTPGGVHSTTATKHNGLTSVIDVPRGQGGGRQASSINPSGVDGFGPRS